MINNFYTYAYLRQDRTPYYIGKGSGKRIYSKQRGVNAPNDKSRIIFLKKNLTEAEAFKHEVYMIAVLGRKELRTGILRNLTNGGEGVSGMVVTKETRNKIATGHQNRSNEEKAKTSSLLSKIQHERPLEQKIEISRKKSIGMKKAVSSYSPERKAKIKEKKAKGFALAIQNRTPEEKEKVAANVKAAALKREQRRTREDREQIKKKKKETWKNKSLEPHQFQCTITGFISSTPQGLTKYQKRRGIDTSNRIQIS